MNPEQQFQTPNTNPTPNPNPTPTPNPEPYQSQAPVQVNNPLSVMQQGERNIFEVSRHPIGVLGINISGAVLMIVIAVLAFGIIPAFVSGVSKTELYEIGAVVFLVFLILTGAFVFIANKVYKGNRWILTSDSLTQVQQTSLFEKQSSQLSLGNLEDVTAEQDGILCHMFNYGDVKVETAGERSKFVFIYCPNPEKYAQQILNAREQFEQNRRSDEQRSYRDAGSYGQGNTPGVNQNTQNTPQ